MLDGVFINLVLRLKWLLRGFDELLYDLADSIKLVIFIIFDVFDIADSFDEWLLGQPFSGFFFKNSFIHMLDDWFILTFFFFEYFLLFFNFFTYFNSFDRSSFSFYCYWFYLRSLRLFFFYFFLLLLFFLNSIVFANVCLN